MIKKLISSSLGLSLLFVAVAPTFAVTGCQNLTTGPYSYNRCSAMLSKLQTLSVNNFGTAFHTINKTVNSGNNSSNNNTISAGIVQTGNAHADVFSLASVNTGMIGITQTDPAADFIGTNNITGPSSNNTVDVTSNKTITINITNNGTVNHTVTTIVNSGGNTANNNTISGGIHTGNATSNTTVQTILNSFQIMIQQ